MISENKKDILVRLKALLNLTRAGMNIKDLVLSEDGCMVFIYWEDGYRMVVSVEADSGIALIRDIIKVL